MNAVAHAARTAVTKAVADKAAADTAKPAETPKGSSTSTKQADSGASTPRTKPTKTPKAAKSDASSGVSERSDTQRTLLAKLTAAKKAAASELTNGAGTDNPSTATATATGKDTDKDTDKAKAAAAKIAKAAAAKDAAAKLGADKKGDTEKQPAAVAPPAGGERNARTNEPPAGTSAAELDAAVPEGERDAAVQAQEQAQQQGNQAAYYEEHPTYVDPESGKVYDASYDAESGELTLTRNDDQVTNPPIPELPTAPHAPTSTRDDDYIEEPEPQDGPKHGKDATKPKDTKSEGTKSTTPTPKPQDSDTHDHEAEGIAHSHGDDGVDGIEDSAAIDGFGNGVGGGKDQHDRTFIVDETIVIAADGSTDTTTSYALPETHQNGTDEAYIVEEHADPKGKVTSNTTTRETTRTEDGGVVTDRTAVTTEGDEQTQEFSNERTDPNGDTTSRTTKIELEDGVVQSDHRIDRATTDELSISDSQYTAYEDGKPEKTTVMRTASVDGAVQRDYYTVAYDDAGFSVSIDPAPEGDRDPLDAWIDEQLGPIAPDEQRPGFGVIRNGGDYEYEGRTTRNPIYLSSIGVRTEVDGVDVFIEGDSVAASSSLDNSITALRESWAGMPADMQGAAHTIDLLQGRSNGDRGNSTKFDSEFHAGASAGGTHMTYWLDNDPNVNTTRHEYGHLSGENGGSPDEEAWDAAMEADQAVGLREELGDVDDEDIRFIAGMDPLLTDELGATSYADKHLSTNGNENDDWAESIMMYLSSRENGGLVQVRQDDGTVKTYTFEDLYPERAQILDGYYNLGPAPEVEAPEWPEETASGLDMDLGNLGGIAGSLAGAAKDMANTAQENGGK